MPPIDPFAAGFSGGGEGLGSAKGTITLDTSSLINAERISKSVGRNIEQNLAGIGRGAQTVKGGLTEVGTAIDSINQRSGGIGGAITRGLSGFSSTIRSIRSELLAIGGAGALLTGFGLGASNEIRVAKIRLGQFVSTEEEASDLMNTLVTSANRFGLEIGEVLSFAGTLLPVIQGNVDATAEWVQRAARLRTVFPAAVRGAELRAISEFLAGNAVSLQRLFNISQGIIADAKAQFSDLGDQLDYILDRMGATEEAALAIADPMVAVKNELKLIGSEAFTPLLSRLREVLPGVREFLATIRETRPELLEIGGAAAVAAATAAPLLIFAGSLLSTLQKIKALGIAGTLGKIGLAGLAIGGAAFAVTEGTQAIGRATGNERLENQTFLGIMRDGLKAIGDIFFGFAALMGPVLQAIIDRLTDFSSAILTIYNGLGIILSRIGAVIPADLGGRELLSAGDAIQGAAAEARVFADNLKEANENRMPGYLAQIAEAREGLGNFVDRLFGFGGGGASTGSATNTLGGALGAGAGVSEIDLARAEAWQAYQDQIAAIEDRFQQQRLAITEQYEAQRTSIIAQYEKTIAREAEDFARQRARAEAQLQSDIAAVQQDGIEREAEWWADLNDTIADLREDSAERIADIEEKANRDREKMERDHRLTLLEAAARLDAGAIANEQRRFKSQSADFEHDLAFRLEKERQNLQERIAQEQEGFQERLQEARAADAKRIEDLKASFEERTAVEDEDRAIRLKRMQEDHLEQLIELKRQNRERLTEIKQQNLQELNELKREFILRNIELTNYYNAWQQTQTSEQQRSLDEWSRFWVQWANTQKQALGGGGTAGGGSTGGTGGTGGTGQPNRAELEQLLTALALQANYSQGFIDALLRTISFWSDARLAAYIEKAFNYDVPGYQMGVARVPRTGPAILHQDETVIKAPLAAMLRQAFGGSGGGAISSSYANNSRSNVSIMIQTQPGQSNRDIGREVEKVMTGLFKQVNQ